MPLPLNLYCQPADIWDYLGTEGADMRLDDHNLSSGQTVSVTTDTPAAATSLPVVPLVFPLLRGELLNFDGGGMASVVQVQLTAVAPIGATSLSVVALPGPVNNGAAASDSGVNVATGQRLVKACQYGTSHVKLYCQPRYDDSELQNSWSVNRWATYLGSRWLTSRRGQSPPGSIANDAKEALEEMKQVRNGQLNIDDAGLRTSGWPFLSNITIDIGYSFTKARVEPQISELTPTLYPQYLDWNSALSLEW